MARPEENGHKMMSFTGNKFAPLESGDSEDTDDQHNLPSDRSRNGKWWYSTYHNVTAMVGAGVLSLPTTMAYLGWGIGTVVMVISWVITLYTLWQMVQMHEMDEMGMERIDSYHELGRKAFGPKWGLWIVVPQQLTVQVGLDIVYIVTGGQCLWRFYQLVRCRHLDLVVIANGTCCGDVGPTAFIMIFAVPQFFLAQLGNFNSIATLSVAASVTSICYCTIAWALSIEEGRNNHSAPPPIGPVSYDFPETTTANQVFGAFSALGTIAFAYAGHNVVLEIQATLPSGHKKPSKILMWRGVVVAYFILAICYFPVAFAGYWSFGNSTANLKGGNILLKLRHPRWLLAAANLMVVVHMTGSYQLYAVPVFAMMESVLMKKFGIRRARTGSTSTIQIVTRSIYVLLTTFIACTFPFFEALLGLVGGFALAPTTYFLPCIIWLRLRRDITKASWFINWALIVIGVLLALVATIGGMRNFIVEAKTFEFYQFTSKDCKLHAMAPSSQTR